MTDADLRSWALAHQILDPHARAVLALLDRVTQMQAEKDAILSEWQGEVGALQLRVADLEAALAPIAAVVRHRRIDALPPAADGTRVRYLSHVVGGPGCLTLGDLRRAAGLLGKGVAG